MLTHWEGEPVEVLRGLWEVPLLEIHASIGSTNDRAEELRASGAAPFTAVLAEEQTSGRGRSGSRWVSEPGRGVWLSVLAPATRSPAGGTVLPLLAGLAVAGAVEEVVPGAEARVKWPNDVLVGERKVAGVLCERAVAREPAPLAVVGVGVNVRPLPPNAPNEVRRRAVALEEVAGERVSRVLLTGRLLRGIRRLLGTASARLDPEVRRELEARDALRGRTVEAEGGLRGVARGVDDDGALVLEEADGTVQRLRSGRLARVEGMRMTPDEGGSACTS